MKITTLFLTMATSLQVLAGPSAQECTFSVKTNDNLATTSISVGLDSQNSLTMTGRIFDQAHPDLAPIAMAQASYVNMTPVSSSDLDSLKYMLSNSISHAIPDDLTADQIGSIEAYQGLAPDTLTGDQADLEKMNFYILLVKDKSGNLLKNSAGQELKIGLFFVTAQLCGTTSVQTQPTPPPPPPPPPPAS